jgi:hypothetical protein
MGLKNINQNNWAFEKEGKNFMGRVPESYFVGQELNWGAPWVDVCLWVELPFWLMVENTTISIDAPRKWQTTPQRARRSFTTAGPRK